jgi:uncharacterized protein YdhG (YjbR/CyaY superfamily)
MASKFTAEEREAMKARAAEAKAEKGRAAGLKAIDAEIEKLPDGEQALARALHETILEAAPELMPRTWYGQPAYEKDGAVVVFFQAAAKFSTRYLTLGFQDAARLDDGTMWATSYAVTELTAANRAEITQLVRTAVGA